MQPARCHSTISRQTYHKKRHDVQGQSISVEVDECMRNLTRNADPIKILDDPLIKSERDLLWKLGSARSPIDIFNEKTWGDVDYTPLQSIVHAIVAVHPAQNQRVENHVQLAALVRSTHVGQARATARAMIHSYLVRRYNVASVVAKKAKTNDKTKREKVVQTKDKERIMGFADYMDEFDQGISKMESVRGYEEKVKEIVDDMKSTKNKTSAGEHKKKVASFGQAVKKKRRIITAESKTEGVHITAAVGMRIVVSFLGASKPGHRAAVDIEMSTRNIAVGEQIKWRAKMVLLKKHELGILAARPNGATIGGKAMTFMDVKECVPQSAELRALLPEQNLWQAERRKRR